MAEPTDNDVMTNLARMLGTGGPAAALGTAMEIPGVLLELGDVLDEHNGVVDQAVAGADALHIWAVASPEARAAMLLNLAWSAREATLPDGAALTTGGMYAVELLTYARNYPGDGEAFHGRGFPALPLPGQAGALASSMAFDRDDLPISLEAVLLLLSLVRPHQQR